MLFEVQAERPVHQYGFPLRQMKPAPLPITAGRAFQRAYLSKPSRTFALARKEPAASPMKSEGAQLHWRIFATGFSHSPSTEKVGIINARLFAQRQNARPRTYRHAIPLGAPDTLH